ncbi:outer membrane beta-barrel protein [Methyloglobulus sp.]|uniref:outer membrane protein n=1 Tax=Methyloglobulus sp. TaxID=2518622 RepID=UPI0032B772F0
MSSIFKFHALALTGLLVSTTAIAEEHKAYVQFNAGAAFAEPFKDSDQICNNFFGCSSFSYKENSNTGYAASLALGYRIADQFRLEGEAMYQSNDLNKAHLSVNSGNFKFNDTRTLKGESERMAFLLNAYYDFKNSTAFTPYITGGLGGYHMRIKASRGRLPGENDLDFAWQAGAGVNYKLDDRISFDLKYRYFSGANAEVVVPHAGFNGIAFVDRTEFHQVGDHQIMAGIRIGF